MTKPDDSYLERSQYLKVRSEAEKLLNLADANGTLPTPVSRIMEAADVEEIPDAVLDLGFLETMRRKAGSALKRALGKVLGLFDAYGRLVFIDRTLHKVKQTFIRLHETGHGFMRWQCDAYAIVEESRDTLDPDVAELFEREANVFASEVLFQLDHFTNEAEEHEFGILTPVNVGKKYGASIYASIRRYVSQSYRTCVVLVLDKPELVAGDGYRANLRRVIASKSYEQIFGTARWPQHFTPSDRIGAMIPLGKKRMSGRRRLDLKDLNGDSHECLAEAFTQGWQVFVLIHEKRALTSKKFFINASM